MNLDEFDRHISLSDSTSLHTSDVTLLLPITLHTIVQGVLNACNVAHVYDLDHVNAVVSKCKFAGHFRSGAFRAENILIGLDVERESGKGQVLVVMRDSVLAQRLLTSIKQALPLQVAST